MLRSFALVNVTLLVMVAVTATPVVRLQDAGASGQVDQVDVRPRQLSFPGDWPPPKKKEVPEGKIDLAHYHRIKRLKALEENEVKLNHLLGPKKFRPDVSKHAKAAGLTGVKPIAETADHSEPENTGVLEVPRKSEKPAGGQVKGAKEPVKDSKPEMPTAPENDGKIKLEAKQPITGSITTPEEEEC